MIASSKAKSFKFPQKYKILQVPGVDGGKVKTTRIRI